MNLAGYKVTFEHSLNPKYFPNLKRKTKKDEATKVAWKAATLCSIEGVQSTWNALSYTNPVDNFCKEKGRRIALKRALAKAFPGEEGKQIRKSIWEAYLGRKSNLIHATKNPEQKF